MRPMKLKKLMAMWGARRPKRWLLDEEKANEADVPFDNTYRWVGQGLRKAHAGSGCRRRRAYVWVLKGCALGKVLGYESVSVIESSGQWCWP